MSWGTFFTDFDNDGREDLYLATTSTDPILSDRLYHNLGQGQFADVSASTGASNSAATIGAAYADYDGDGRMDFVVGNLNEGYRLYRNVSAQTNNWLRVRLAAAQRFDRAAVGAEVILHHLDGATQRRYVHVGSSIGSNHQPDLHFGLGDHEPKAIQVIWPDGSAETFAIDSMNATVCINYQAPELLHLDGFELKATAALNRHSSNKNNCQ